jgi:GWxTD domain-containing protein
MKTAFTPQITAFFVAICLLCSSNLAKALDVTTTTTLFQSSKGEPYIEVYSYFVATSVKYQRMPQKQKRASVRILYLIKQGDAILQADKFALNSPLTDSLARPSNFLALKRFMLPVGKYTLEATYTDANDEKNTRSTKLDIVVENALEKVELSEIALISKAENSENENHPFFKNGAIMEPLVMAYYPVGYNSLQFYAEAYRTKSVLKDDAFAIRYYIETPQASRQKIEIIGNKRLTANEVTPFLGSLDISQLPSGNYNLVVELRNRSLEVIAVRKCFFQRSNPFLQKPDIVLSQLPVNQMFTKNFTKDSCNWSLTALLPQLEGESQNRVLAILKEPNLDQKRTYIFSFWTSRYPANGENAYKQYMTLVQELDDKYTSYIRKGHMTDRGRVWLKYGKPDNYVIQETEVGASPYEIWTYDRISDKQSTGKFIFYNPSLAANDYELLHSTVRGERQDPQWQRKIYKNAQTNDRDYINGTSTQDVMGGGRVNDLFNDN